MKKYKYLFLFVISVLVLTGCGTNKYKDLSCTKKDGVEEITVKYTFENGKAKTYNWIITTANNNADPEIFEEMFNKINDINGCSGTYERTNDNIVTTNEKCDFSKMTDEDTQAVLMQDKKDLEQTREELIKFHTETNEMTCE